MDVTEVLRLGNSVHSDAWRAVLVRLVGEGGGEVGGGTGGCKSHLLRGQRALDPNTGGSDLCH